MGGTKFATIYNRFLGKITDDMYVELTPEDTLKDIQRLLINSLPGFEFPRKNLYDYTVNMKIIDENELKPEDFLIGVIWNDFADEIAASNAPPKVLIDCSTFACELTAEEENIIAILMMEAWL